MRAIDPTNKLLPPNDYSWLILFVIFLKNSTKFSLFFFFLTIKYCFLTITHCVAVGASQFFAFLLQVISTGWP
jgi:hypothetical protein